ncbi:MAG: hypothetical protein VW738_13085, partial [Pseudomonadales bacterium]
SGCARALGFALSQGRDFAQHPKFLFLICLLVNTARSALSKGTGPSVSTTGKGVRSAEPASIQLSARTSRGGRPFISMTQFVTALVPSTGVAAIAP